MQIDDILTLNSLSDLNADKLAHFAVALIAHEIQPGGPYQFNHPNNTALNKKITQLLEEVKQSDTPSASMPPALSLAQPQKHHKSSKPASNPAAIWHAVQQTCEAFLHSQNQPRQTHNQTIQELTALQNTLRATDTNGEISKLSSYFYASLRTIENTPNSRHYTHTNTTPTNLLDSLALANCYTWLAYSIYDSIVDENTLTSLLPVANHLSRQALALYLAAHPLTHAPNDSRSNPTALFTETDQAMAYEIKLRSHRTLNAANKTIRINTLPNIEQLKQSLSLRSSAHIAGPLLLTHALLPKSTHHAICKALRAYCSAKQLLDDIHDWHNDMSAGRITYPVAKLLQDAQLQHTTMPLNEATRILRRTAFHSTLPTLLQEAQQCAEFSKQALENHAFTTNSPFITFFINPLITSAKQALQQNQFNKQFLRSFTKVG